MHIAEGILAPEVLIGGAVLTVAGTALGLRKVELDDVPRVATLTAAFFVASLIHVPIGLASVHLVLNGLVGIVLGWAAFPAILVALTLQMLFFGFGGLTTMGVNTLTMAAPAVLCYLFFNKRLLRATNGRSWTLGFIAGALAVVLSGTFVALSLYASGQAFAVAAGAVLVAHIPVTIIEGVVTGFAVAFLAKVRPETLHPLDAFLPEEERSVA